MCIRDRDFPDGKFAILSEGEALPPRKPRARKAKVRDSSRQRLESFTCLLYTSRCV